MKYLITYMCKQETTQPYYGTSVNWQARPRTVNYSYGYEIVDDFVDWLLSTQNHEGETYFMLNVIDVSDVNAERLKNMKGM